MTGESRLSVRRSVAVLMAVALLAAGAGSTYLLMRIRSHTGDPMVNVPRTEGAAAPIDQPVDAPAASDAPLPDVVVLLSQEAVERAGIVVTPVSSEAAATAIRSPGIVEPNAYRQVAVTPLVAGRVTRVFAALGDRVRGGQTMAQIYSPELAEAQTRYISARAQLEAHERELQRTQKLVEIGAASRRELERIHAEHTVQVADVDSARSRLTLLGVPSAALDNLAPGKEVSATTNVPAPIAGVITERLANVGLNVDPSAKLFTVVDLSTVWVVADIYEKDFSRVRIGSPTTITTIAYPDLVLEGRVSYIDPQVSPETRTAKVRIEAPNPRNELRLGMYVDVTVARAGGAPAPVLPRSVVQNVGDRQVVYLANPKEPGRFIEREVRLGQTSAERVEVLSGVRAGDVVVIEGSFFLRAERERLGLRQAAGPSVAEPAKPDRTRAPGGSPAAADLQTAHVTVSDQGYEPSKLTLRAGVPARITFLRTSDKTCGTEVVFPALNIKRDLPLNKPVNVDFTPKESGDIGFVCGMNMLRGTIVVQ